MTDYQVFFCSFVADVYCSNGKEFCVATTHLLYNPKAGEVKLAQMSCLFAELHRMATIPGMINSYVVIHCHFRYTLTDKSHVSFNGSFAQNGYS